MQERMEKFNALAQDRERELSEFDKAAYKREMTSRRMLEQKLDEIEKYKSRQQTEQLEREREFQGQLEAREQFFQDREKSLTERNRLIEEKLSQQQQMLEADRYRIENLRKEREAEYLASVEALEREKEKYRADNRAKIERTANTYVNDALALLKNKEDHFHNISKWWGGLGAASITAGIAFAILTTLVGVTQADLASSTTWAFVAYVAFKGIIVIGLFIALARYAFVFCNSYMHESLKSGERRHAINFGKFYLESYGADAEWSQLKEAFEHWNITSTTAFSKPNGDSFDPRIFDKTAELIEKIAKIIPGNQKTSE